MKMMLITIVFVGETKGDCKESDVVEAYNIHLHILTHPCFVFILSINAHY